jgi:hypothetical protein
MLESLIVLSELGRVQVFGKIGLTMAVGGEMIAYYPYFYVQNGLQLGRYTHQHMPEKGMQL